VRIRLVLVGYLLGATGLLAAYQLEEPDLWFHLAMGRYVVTEQVVPSVDPFVYSSPPTGAAWLRMHWLWQVLTYRLATWIGIEGLNLCKVIAVVGLMGAALAVGRVSMVALATAPLALALLAWRFHPRPELVTWAMMVGWVAVLERERSGVWCGPSKQPRPERRQPTRWLWVLPVATVIWVNMHVYFVLGWVILAAYLIEAMVERRGGHRLTGVLLLCVAASLLNPTGWRGAILPLQYLADIARQGNVHLRAIHEQQPLLLSGWFRESGLMEVYWVLVALVVLGWCVSTPRRVSHGLLLAFFAGFSLLAIRNLPLLAWGSIVLAPREVAPRWREWAVDVWRDWGEQTQRLVRGVVLAALPLLTVALAVQVASNHWYLDRGNMRQFGLGVLPGLAPDRAVDWLEQQPLSGRIFTNFDSAGYLLWRHPEWPVYFHGCADFRNPRFIDYRRFMEAPERYPDFLQPHGVTTVLLSHTAQDTDRLIRHLSRDASWRLSYLDDSAAIFTTADRSIPPLDTSPAALTKVGIGAPGELPWLWASFFRSGVLGMLGWMEAATVVLERAHEHFPDVPFVSVRLGYLYAQQGRIAEATAAYERALASDPDNPIACYNLGLLYLQQERAEAVEWLQRAVRRKPDLAPAHYHLAVWYAYVTPTERRAARHHAHMAQRLGLAIPEELWRAVGEGDVR